MDPTKRLLPFFKQKIENINYTLDPTNKCWALVIQIRGGQGQIELDNVDHSCFLGPRFGNIQIQYESRFFYPETLHLPFATTQLSTIIQGIHQHRDNDYGMSDSEIDTPQYQCQFCIRKYFMKRCYNQHVIEIHPNQAVMNFNRNADYEIYYDGLNITNMERNTLIKDIFNTFGIGLKTADSMDGAMTPEDGVYLRMIFVMTHKNDPNMSHYPIDWIQGELNKHLDEHEKILEELQKETFFTQAPEIYNYVQAYRIKQNEKISLEKDRPQEESKQDTNNQAHKPDGLDFHPSWIAEEDIDMDKWGQLIVYQTDITSAHNYGYSIGYRLYIIWLNSNKQIKFLSTTDSSSGGLYRTVNKEFVWNGTDYSYFMNGENGKWMLRFKSKRDAFSYSVKYMKSVRWLRCLFRPAMLHNEALAYDTH